MKFPKKVQIGDSEWKVVRNRKVMTYYGQQLDGFCDEAKKTIYVYARLPYREALITYLHELGHAISFEHDFELGHDVIELLEGPLADFIIDNFFCKS